MNRPSERQLSELRSAMVDEAVRDILKLDNIVGEDGTLRWVLDTIKELKANLKLTR